MVNTQSEHHVNAGIRAYRSAPHRSTACTAWYAQHHPSAHSSCSPIVLTLPCSWQPAHCGVRCWRRWCNAALQPPCDVDQRRLYSNFRWSSPNARTKIKSFAFTWYPAPLYSRAAGSSCTLRASVLSKRTHELVPIRTAHAGTHRAPRLVLRAPLLQSATAAQSLDADMTPPRPCCTGRCNPVTAACGAAGNNAGTIFLHNISSDQYQQAHRGGVEGHVLVPSRLGKRKLDGAHQQRCERVVLRAGNHHRV